MLGEIVPSLIPARPEPANVTSLESYRCTEAKMMSHSMRVGLTARARALMKGGSLGTETQREGGHANMKADVRLHRWLVALRREERGREGFPSGPQREGGLPDSWAPDCSIQDPETRGSCFLAPFVGLHRAALGINASICKYCPALWISYLDLKRLNKLLRMRALIRDRAGDSDPPASEPSVQRCPVLPQIACHSSSDGGSRLVPRPCV